MSANGIQQEEALAEPMFRREIVARRSGRLANIAQQRMAASCGTRSGWPQIFTAMGVDALWLSSLSACGLLAAWFVGMPLVQLQYTLAIWVAGVVTTFYLFGLYPVVMALPAAELRRLTFTLAGSGLLMIAGQLGYAWQQPQPQLVVGLVVLAATFTLPLVRTLSRHVLSRFSWWGRRVLLVGGNEQAAKILGTLQKKPRMGLRPIGVLAEYDELHADIPANMHLGSPRELAEIAKAWNISMVVLVPNHDDNSSMVELIHAAESNVNSWIMVPPTRDVPAMWTQAYDLTGRPALGWNNQLSSGIHRGVKRAFDLFLVLTFMPLWLPLCGVIAALIKLTSQGDIFFFQERVGRNRQSFRCWKFRTMHPNNRQLLEAYLEANPEMREEWERNFKLRNDPRVTWIGRFLRKASLDELPQLFNVLRGEMSLVGPRPLLESETQRYGDALSCYVQMEPGITGMWQISGRSNTSFAERAWYDEYYVRNWSPWLDVYILGCTIKVVLKCEGAY